MLLVAMAQSSFNRVAIRKVLLVLWMTLRFHSMGPMGQKQAWLYFNSSPGGGTSWTSRQLVFGCVHKMWHWRRSLLSMNALIHNGVSHIFIQQKNAHHFIN